MHSPFDIQRLGRVVRTVMHLRPSQWWWRARYSMERQQRIDSRRAARWSWDGLKPPRINSSFPELAKIAFEAHEHIADLVSLRGGIFQHLNSSHVLGYDQPNWRLGIIDKERLWTITLHYHDWAYALAEMAEAEGPEAEEAAALFKHYVSDWITRCSLEAPGARNLAWNSYAIATRIPSWIKSYQALGSARWRSWGEFESEFLNSLWQQAAYLHDHLEWDLLANHLLRDAVGLASAGRFFHDGQAQRWLATSTQLAHDQLREQLLPDGGHFERSPMYHLQVMADLAYLAMLLEDAAVRRSLTVAWGRMAEYSAWMQHPDGRIPLLNDSALHPEDAYNQTTLWAKQLDLALDASPRRGGRFFSDSGVAVWQGDPWTIFFDVGRLGPDYQPGHAHADTLSIECSYRGRRLFVDPGTFGYDRDERRRYDRSTRAHNTVCIDNQDSSEVWDIFRVGRRAYPLDVEVDFSDHGMTAAASHTGYDHLPGRPRHMRQIAVNENGSLNVLDRVQGNGRHLVQGGFLLNSDWIASTTEDGWILKSGSDKVRVQVHGGKQLTRLLGRRPYHPQFGCEIETSRLTWEVEVELPVEVSVLIEQA